MTMIDKGGPAFPQIELHQVTGHPFAQHFGMTLRDYFAAQCLGSVMGVRTSSPPSPDSIAKACYALADAMLKAREA
jgi:hypothetical protein